MCARRCLEVACQQERGAVLVKRFFLLWAEVEVAEALEEALDAELEEDEAALEVLLALPLVLERAEVASVEPVVEALPVPL
jgi:hypothetical protein